MDFAIILTVLEIYPDIHSGCACRFASHTRGLLALADVCAVLLKVTGYVNSVIHNERHNEIWWDIRQLRCALFFLPHSSCKAPLQSRLR